MLDWFPNWIFYPLLQHSSNFNSLPNDKILDSSKFKASAVDKIIFDSKIEIWVGKRRKHCWKKDKLLVTSIFKQCFHKLSFPAVLEVGIVW